MSIGKQAFESQVLELLGPMQGVAVRLTCNEAAAEDLVAETVARAWKAVDSVASIDSFRSWIFRILHNLFISEVRYAKARPWMQAYNCEEIEEETTEFSLFEQMHQPFLLWFSNPEQEFLDNLLRDDLEAALDALPAHYRIVAVLADLEEFSYQEIAETLEIPVGTVRSRLARARAMLQKALWRQAEEHGLHPSIPDGATGREGDTTTTTTNGQGHETSGHDFKGAKG